MSISLNNHESRIAALEKNKSAYIETVLWSGDLLWNRAGVSVTLSEPYSNFDLIYTTGYYASGMWYKVVPASQLVATPKSGTYRSLHHDPDVCWIPFSTNDSVTITCTQNRDNTPLSILRIVGVRFTKVILYNFSYIIIHLVFTPLSYLFNKEV